MNDHPTPQNSTDAVDAPAAAPTETPPTGSDSWKTPLLIASALLGGLVIGGTAGWAITAAQMTPQIQDLQRDADGLSADLTKMTAAHDRLWDEQEEIVTHYTDKLAELSATEADLKAREAAVTQREKKVTAVESTSFTSGVLIVGTDVAAGTYRTTGVDDCYYAWMSGTGSDADIIDNNIVSGTATVTLTKGDVFESSSRCGTWTKIG